MLCGIGGRTIAEAQQNLSYGEVMAWIRYRRKRGSLNLGLRVERGAAMLAAMYANAHSKDGGFRVNDFAPHLDEPPVTLQQAMEMWK